ncbi:chaplin [Streptomyces lateritius]|uniref:chaplin n=1 Tax=Streptomyces lateritius TaxID=67313 RepID=UPI0013163541|nr:chaplin [Streptomyces lateritius]QGZ50670.1 DUF320 domain-containing protein [Streptomyces sp. QHH-9511]
MPAFRESVIFRPPRNGLSRIDVQEGCVVVAGNVVQVPIDAPINACGNSIDIIRLLDSVGGDACGNF